MLAAAGNSLMTWQPTDCHRPDMPPSHAAITTASSAGARMRRQAVLLAVWAAAPLHLLRGELIDPMHHAAAGRGR